MTRASHTFRSAAGVLRGYVRDLGPLRRAGSVQELVAWARSTGTGASFGFNGDVLRARVVHALFTTAGCTAFLETGTYRGSTTVLAARLLGCPVYSAELDARSWLLSSLRCAPLRNVRTIRADSRAFLRQMAASLAHEVPFIYLDAHWNADLPLQGELDLICQTWSRFVILVDDFQVPDRPAFGFDAYGGRALSLGNVRIPRRREEKRSGIFFPGYEPELEVGARRGYVVVVVGLRDRLGECDHFPLGLLREHTEGANGAT